MTNIHRRSLLQGVASLLAAPAIVRASSIMPVKSYPLLPHRYLGLAQMKTEGGLVDYDRYDDTFREIRWEYGGPGKLVRFQVSGHDAYGNRMVEWTEVPIKTG